jgi:hypothetical protein
LSAAEAAAAVHDDALAGDEAGVFGGEEADGVGLRVRPICAFLAAA